MIGFSALISLAVGAEVATLRFWTSNSQAFYDYSRNDNHAVSGKTAAADASDVAVSTHGAEFSVTGQVITLPPNDFCKARITVESSFTAVAWLSPKTLTGTIFTRTDQGRRIVGFDISGQTGVITVMDAVTTVSLASLAVDTWQIVGLAVSCSSSGCSAGVYVDSLPVQTATLSVVLEDAAEAVFTLSEVSSGYSGLMYEFRWFDTALDSSAFLSLFRAPSSTEPCTTVFSTVVPEQCLPATLSANSPTSDCPATCATCEMLIAQRCVYSDSSCFPSCGSCFGPNSSDCDTCADRSMRNVSGECVCPPHFFALGQSTCVECFYGCKECSAAGEDQCSDCNSPAALSASNTCDCPAGMFMEKTASCSLCSSLCSVCDGLTASDCLACHSNAEIASGAPFGPCVCSRGFYGSPASCQPCNSICATCEHASDCTSCRSNAHVSAGVCVCDAGFFPSSDASNCQSCDPTCSRCDSAGNTNCSECYPNAALQTPPKSQCECVGGFYPSPDSSLCAACDPDCKTCAATGQSQCLTCNPHAALVAAAPAACACDQGYAGLPSACEPCDVSCALCSSAFPSGCESCKSHAVLISSAPSGCTCVLGYYPSPHPGSCSLCDPTCKSCSGASSQCTDCFPGAHLDQSACKCDFGRFPNTTEKDCAVCFSACASCAGPTASDCLTCAEAAVAPVAGFCACAGNQYSLASGLCANCHISCQTCSAGTQLDCLTCKLNASFIAGVGCTCNDGFSGLPEACVPCSSVCRTCSVPRICLSCKANALVLPGNPGVCLCANGFFPNPDAGLCASCDSTCVSCSAAGSNSCISCHTNAKLASIPPSTCVCSDSFFPSPDSSSCLPCHTSCFSCSGSSPSACLSCYTRAQISAAASCACSQGFYPNPDESHCEECAVLCATCADAVSGCLTCVRNSEKSGSSCICSAGFYLADKQCLPCHATCGRCTAGDSHSCVSCPNNSNLLSAECLCASGFRREGTTLQCVAVTCAEGCSQCSSAGTCIGCFPHAVLPAGGAHCVCSSGFFPSPSASNCVACEASCGECADGTETGCTACKSNARLNGPWPTSCVCEPGFFPSPDAAKCRFCPPNCDTCWTAGSCRKCRLGFFLLREICFRCVEDCLQCSDVETCEVCAKPRYATTTGLCKLCGNCAEPLLASISGPSGSLYTLSFSRNITSTLRPSDFRIETVPLTPVSWTIQQGVNLTIAVSAASWDGITALLVSLLVPISDEFGFSLLNSDFQLPPPAVHTEDSPPSTVNETVNRLVTAVSAVVGSGAVAASVATGGGSLAIALLSHMQYFSYIGTVNYHLTEGIAGFYHSLDQKAILPNPFSAEKHLGRRLEGSSGLTTDFLSSSGQYVTVLGAAVAAHASVTVAACAKFSALERVRRAFVWNVYCYLWAWAYLDVVFGALVHIKANYDNWTDGVIVAGHFLSLSVLIAAAATPIWLVFYLTRRRSALCPAEGSRVRERFSCLVATTRRDRRTSLLFLPCYFLQRLLYSLLIVTLSEHERIQLLLAIPSGIMTVYVATCLPMARRVSRPIHLVAEVDALAVYALLCTVPRSAALQWTVVALTLKSFACYFLMFLVEIYAGFRSRTVAPDPRLWSEEKFPKDSDEFPTTIRT